MAMAEAAEAAQDAVEAVKAPEGQQQGEVAEDAGQEGAAPVVEVTAQGPEASAAPAEGISVQAPEQASAAPAEGISVQAPEQASAPLAPLLVASSSSSSSAGVSDELRSGQSPGRARSASELAVAAPSKLFEERSPCWVEEMVGGTPDQGTIWRYGKIRRADASAGAVWVVLADGANAGQELQYPEAAVVPELRAPGQEDLIKLPALEMKYLLHNLWHRFSRGLPYTYVGPMLISVNPYTTLPLYGRKEMLKYRGRALGEEAPHCYAVAEEAYERLLRDQEAHAVVISGESGAGKTEAAKVEIKTPLPRLRRRAFRLPLFFFLALLASLPISLTQTPRWLARDPNVQLQVRGECVRAERRRPAPPPRGSCLCCVACETRLAGSALFESCARARGKRARPFGPRWSACVACLQSLRSPSMLTHTINPKS